MADRINQLRKEISEAKKAEQVLDYAKMVLEDAKIYALQRLLDPESDMLQVRADYKAAMALYQRINGIYSKGILAEDSLRKLEE